MLLNLDFKASYSVFNILWKVFEPLRYSPGWIIWEQIKWWVQMFIQAQINVNKNYPVYWFPGKFLNFPFHLIWEAQSKLDVDECSFLLS
jgi:hypothetical protein